MSNVLGTLQDVQSAIENGQNTVAFVESQINAATSASGPDAEQQIIAAMDLISDAIAGPAGGALKALLTATKLAGDSAEARKYQNTFLRHSIDWANAMNDLFLPEYTRPDGYPEGYPVPERQSLHYPDGDYYNPEDLLSPEAVSMRCAIWTATAMAYLTRRTSSSPICVCGKTSTKTASPKPMN